MISRTIFAAAMLLGVLVSQMATAEENSIAGTWMGKNKAGKGVVMVCNAEGKAEFSENGVPIFADLVFSHKPAANPEKDFPAFIGVSAPNAGVGKKLSVGFSFKNADTIVIAYPEDASALVPKFDQIELKRKP